MNTSKRSNHVTEKDNAETTKDIMTTSGQIQPLKIPDAVVALAQAAAKANGETEKYLPGWPLFSPPKLQLDKCTKCSREFCSSINFRRHTRVHRRTLKLDKDFPKNRDHVAAFWDKLMADEAKTILSLLDIVIEGVTGSSVLTALTAWMCKPGYASLPVAYARAGSELLDLIQTKAALHLHVSSSELFSVLDEASENTFLCTNTTASIQKFLFDGEADEVATELKNVVACASYMLETKLVEAWSADKTAEALRCQRLLVEEEEAAQKRQAELLERKRMKKLRQKEQRLKDLKDEKVTVCLSENMDDISGFPGIQSLEAISCPGLYEQEDSQHPQYQAQYDNAFNVTQSVEDASCDSGHEMGAGVIKSKEAISGHYVGRTENLDSMHQTCQSNHRNSNVCTLSNRNKTLEWKVRSEIEEECPKHELDIDFGQGKNSRVLIGSISVAIHDGSEHTHEVGDHKHGPTPSLMSMKNSVSETVELLSHKEIRNTGNITPALEKHPSSNDTTDASRSSCSTCNADLAGCGHLQRTTFSGEEATAFLSQRWKDAIAGDHVKLVLCPEK